MPLKLHEDSDGYIHIASKFIQLAATKTITMEDINALKHLLIPLKYWEKLEFQEQPTPEEILQKLEQARAEKKRHSLSESKRMLIEALLSDKQSWTSITLTKICNGLLYPQIKRINMERIKAIAK